MNVKGMLVCDDFLSPYLYTTPSMVFSVTYLELHHDVTFDKEFYLFQQRSFTFFGHHRKESRSNKNLHSK